MRLTLTIRIEYAKSKAVPLIDMGYHQLGKILRADLDCFKLPHPPLANIRAPTVNGVEFFYKTSHGSASCFRASSSLSLSHSYLLQPLFFAVLRAFEIKRLAGRRAYLMKNTDEIPFLKRKCAM